jgi:hypothetical protein
VTTKQTFFIYSRLFGDDKNTKHVTVRKAHLNLSKNSFLKLFVKFANSSRNCLSFLYRNLDNRSKNENKKSIFFLFTFFVWGTGTSKHRDEVKECEVWDCEG